MRVRLHALIGASAVALAGCGNNAHLPITAGEGPNPTLPAPQKALLPTVAEAKAVGWSAGAQPTAAPGLKVTAFATGLHHPRWLLVLPNGDVLAAECSAPPQPKNSKGLHGVVEKMVMTNAGANTSAPQDIVLLRDTDGDGTADQRTVLLSGLHSPFGMALVGDTLYVTDTDAVLAYPYKAGQTRIDAPPRKVVDLPAGAINHQWTKNVIATPDG